MIHVVQSNQTLMDIALQRYGNANSIVDLAIDNNLAIDAEVMPGTNLYIRSTIPESGTRVFADYISERDIAIVSGQAEIQINDILSTNDDEVITDNEDNGLQDA